MLANISVAYKSGNVCFLEPYFPNLLPLKLTLNYSKHVFSSAKNDEKIACLSLFSEHVLCDSRQATLIYILSPTCNEGPSDFKNLQSLYSTIQ